MLLFFYLLQLLARKVVVVAADRLTPKTVAQFHGFVFGRTTSGRKSPARCPWCDSQGVQICVCGLKLPKDVSKHLTTALHERRCRTLGIWSSPPPSPGPETTTPTQNVPLLSPVSLSQQNLLLLLCVPEAATNKKTEAPRHYVLHEFISF